jgi:peptidoglycan/LPS O-acetylase OafA/YrhL
LFDKRGLQIVAVEDNRYAALDGWRGVCACLVMLYHFRITSHVYDVTLIRKSFLFVDFFFVLSGFIMANAYFGVLRDRLSLYRFMVLRCGRVYPLHLFTLLAFVAWDLLLLFYDGQAFEGTHSIESLWTNLFMLNAMGLHDGLTWNFPSWSIGAEFYSYVLFALVVVGVGRHSDWAFAGLAAASVAILATAAPAGIGSHHDYGFVRAVFSFCLGFFVWRMHGALAGRPQGAKSSISINWTIAEVAVVAVSVAYVVAPLHSLARLFTPIIFGGVVLVFAQERGWVAAIFRTWLFRLLGNLSYSIYMVHAFIIYRIFDVFAIRAGLTGKDETYVTYNGHLLISVDPYVGDLMYLIYSAFVIGVAFLTFRFVEVPSRAFFRRIASAGISKTSEQVASGG